MARTIENTSIRDWSINYLLISKRQYGAAVQCLMDCTKATYVKKLSKNTFYNGDKARLVYSLSGCDVSKSDRKRSEIRGSCAQGRLDQSRCDGLARTPSKPVRFVARFLRAHLPESHSRGAPAPHTPSPSTRDCQLTRQMTHALAG